MKRKYLVASDDEPISAWEPVIVLADNKLDALERYLRVVYSKDPIFRQSVLDLSSNGSFLEKFFIVSPEGNEAFEKTGQLEYDLTTIKSRVMLFFSERPDLGDRFVSYMDTRDVSHMIQEVFEFISASDPTGLIALDMEEIRHL
jgi:hypothetical protein